MESDSSDPPPRTGAPTPITPGGGDPGDEHYGEHYATNEISNSLFHTAAPLLGVLLGLFTLVLPLAGVLSDRPTPAPATGLSTARRP